jgi:hypothetical protein
MSFLIPRTTSNKQTAHRRAHPAADTDSMNRDAHCPDTLHTADPCLTCRALEHARADERNTVYAEQASGDGWVTARQMIGYEDTIRADERRIGLTSRAEVLHAAAETVAALPGSPALLQAQYDRAPTLCPGCGPKVQRWVTITCDVAAAAIGTMTPPPGGPATQAVDPRDFPRHDAPDIPNDF